MMGDVPNHKRGKPVLMKIAIVCLEFARAQRMRSLAEGLTALGHEVVFITSETNARSDTFTVVAVPYTSSGSAAKRLAGVDAAANAAELAAQRGGRSAEVLVRAVARIRDEFLLYPDKQRAWRTAVREWLGTSPDVLSGIDRVVASMPPVTALYVGLDVAESTGAGLHFDFRDLWTDNPYYPYGRLRRAIDLIAESRVLPRANTMTVATASFCRQLAHSYPRLRPVPVYTGIDPSEWAKHELIPDEAKLRFGYIGITYAGKRDVRPFLRSIARQAAADTLDVDQVSITMIGEIDEAAKTAVRDLGLSERVHLGRPIPQAEVPAALASIDVALLLMWPDDTVSVPLKLRHYLAAGKRIIVSGAAKDSEVVEILKDMPGVTICFSDDDLDEAIRSAWSDWRAGESFSYVTRRPFDSTADAMAAEFLDVMLPSPDTSRRS